MPPNIEPSLSLSDSRSQRYPNQFFDLAQQYMPPTIKELFRWCTFYFYNSPLIGSAMKKVSRYPITDLIFEDGLEANRSVWNTILLTDLKMKDRMMEVNLDYHVYGNAFVSLHFPFIRFLICQSCKFRAPIKNWDWQFRGSDYNFAGTCSQCGSNGAVEVKDVPYKNRKELRIIRWNPENIHIKFNEYTGRYIYMYSVPGKLRNMIQRGDKDILEDLPIIVLEALKKRRMIRFSSDSLKHLKQPTLAEQDQGWGKPAILHVLKDMFYLYTLRRAQEAIALEHIVPFDLIYPLPNAQQDPYIHTDLSSWRIQIESVINKHRRDPNFKAVIPIPIGFGRLGGDGKALLLAPEINYLTQTIVGGLGLPQEFLFGGLNWCLISTCLTFTSEGLLTLGEISPAIEGRRSMDGLSVATKGAPERVALTHRTSPKIPYKIKTKLGLQIAGSKIHRVWVLHEDLSMGWKCLEDIKAGDRVGVSRGDDLWGKESPSPELCRVLGYMVSEGSFTEKRTTFSNTDVRIVEDFCDCVAVLTGKRPSYSTRKYTEESNHFGMKDVHYFDNPSAKLDGILREYMDYGTAEVKRVPKIIRQAKKECVFEFFKALFEGDGCNSVSVNRKQCITYSSISPDLLEQVQLLLLNAGIVSSRYDSYQNADGTSTTPGIQIRSEDAKRYVEMIGFVTKNDVDSSACNPESFRCDYNKIPYLRGLLHELKSRTKGDGAWIKADIDVALEGDFFSVKDISRLLGRDASSITGYIRKGQLKATRDTSNDGRYKPYVIRHNDLREFMDSHGIQKRAAVGQTTWEINANNADYVNWDVVKELDPELFERYEELKATRFVWDEVVETSVSNEAVEMCDLTVHNTHSYIANGLVSHNTGSSVSLRTLENDFIQNRSQMLDLTIWIKDKIRIWLTLPDIKTIRMSDFRMADDIQKNQQLIGLNAQRKVSDQTLLTELGYDYDQEVKKMIEEQHVQNYLTDLQTKSSARSQGEAMLIQSNYQRTLQENVEKAQLATQERASRLGITMPGQAGVDPNAGAVQGAPGMDPSGGGGQQPEKPMDELVMAKVDSWASQLAKMDPGQAAMTLSEIKSKMPEIGIQIEQRMSELQAGSTGGQAPAAQVPQTQVAAPSGEPPAGINMNPLPERSAPRRQGAV